MSGRIRSIKPEVLEDELAASLSDAAWRLWVSLWVLADDHGNVRLGDRYLAANVWQDTTRDAATPRAELLTAGLVSAYAVNGQRYGHINGWEKHQRVDNAGKPRVPTPEEDDGSCPDNSFVRLRENSRKASASLRALPLAQSGGETSDLRPPTADLSAPAIAASATPTEPKTPKTPRGARGTRLPEDWQPTPELLDRLRRELRVEPEPAIRRFVTYWVNATRNAVKPRWDLAFEHWVERDKSDGKLTAIEPEYPIHRAPGREKFIPKSPEEVAQIMGKDAVTAT